MGDGRPQYRRLSGVGLISPCLLVDESTCRHVSLKTPRCSSDWHGVRRGVVPTSDLRPHVARPFDARAALSRPIDSAAVPNSAREGETLVMGGAVDSTRAPCYISFDAEQPLEADLQIFPLGIPS